MTTRDAFLMTRLSVRNYLSCTEFTRAFGCKENTALDTVGRVLSAIHGPLSAAPILQLNKQAQLAAGNTLFNVSGHWVPSISTVDFDRRLLIPDQQQGGSKLR